MLLSDPKHMLDTLIAGLDGIEWTLNTELSVHDEATQPLTVVRMCHWYVEPTGMPD